MKISVSLYPWYYVAEIPEYGIVTDAKTLDKLLFNINEAFECYFQWEEYQYQIDISQLVFRSRPTHAFDLQKT